MYYPLFLAFMSILAQTFFTLVSGHFMSFLFLSAWHSCDCLFYLLFKTISNSAGEGLKYGISCSGTITVVLREMLRAGFALRVFLVKLPNPRK